MTVHCDFCGLDFDPACNLESGCSGCPLASGCSHITCPRCGYQMLPEAKLISWLRKLGTQFKKDSTQKGNLRS